MLREVDVCLHEAKDGEYITFYINPEAVNTRHIDDQWSYPIDRMRLKTD